MKLRNITRRLAPAVLAAVLAMSPLAMVRADDSAAPAARTFRDDHLTLKIQNNGGVYQGTILLGNKTFNVTARGNGGHLDGTFADDAGNAYPFTADLSGDTLNFQTGKTTYHLAADATAPAAPAAHNAGVGMNLTLDNGAVVVADLVSGGPAERAGVKAGDRLVAIDGRALTSVNDLATLPGSEGTSVKLSFLRGGDKQEFTMTREVTQTPVAQAPADQAPAANNAPDPQLPWLHEGLVISSTWTQWIYPGHSAEFSEDIHGRPNAHTADGKPLMMTEVHGTSGGGVAQLTVSAIEGNTVYVCTNSWADDSVQGMKEPVSQHMPVMETVPLGNCDMWIEPARLAALQSDGAAQILVTAVQWPVGDHQVDAIRVTKTSDGYLDYVYDRKTGMCIHMFTVHQGAAPTMKYHVEGETPVGDTVISRADFISTRDVHTPWAGEALPAWTHQFKALHYRGTSQMTGVPQMGPLSLITMDVASRASSNSVVAANVTLGQTSSGITVVPQHSVAYFGHDMFGSVFAGPAALAKLHVGDQLDNDPVTRMITTVTKADGRIVTIVSKNSGGGSFYTYDVQSGKMLEYGWLDNLSRQAWTYQLAGEE